MAKTPNKQKKYEPLNYSSIFPFYLTKLNYIFLIIAIIVLVIGFYLMTLGEWDSPVSLTIAPLVVLFGYIVVVPFGIFKRFKKN
jgi:membrane protein YdbS with pleckstrin-like domain